MPTRNRAPLLARCVAGVRAQRHPDVELIVVDDGSDAAHAEHNAAIVRETGARAVRLPPTGDRGHGPAFARNAGLAAATGDLLAFCDDDDRWTDPDYLATAAAAFARQADLDLLFADQAAVVSGRSRYTVWQPRLEAALVARGAGAGLVPVSKRECLLDAGSFAHLNICVLRRRALQAVGGFDDALRFCEDLDLVVRLVDRAAAIAHLRRVVSIHEIPDRTLQSNASTRLNRHERLLAQQAIAGRLSRLCTDAAAQDYARDLGAQACRHLARSAHDAGRAAEALAWARQAGRWRGTLRWTAYTQFLRARPPRAGAGRP